MLHMLNGAKGKIINVKPLREQVYQYLRDQINKGALGPGSFINMSLISEELGISKTPLRDALIQLECEGFVTIFPRRGIKVNQISYNDARNHWEICKVLEADVLSSVFEHIDETSLAAMEEYNSMMREATLQEDPTRFYANNVAFHNVFLEISPNPELKRIVILSKQRLYDFLALNHVREWEVEHYDEHKELIRLIREGNKDAAVTYLREDHWSFLSQEHFIRGFYLNDEEADKVRMEGNAL